MSGKMDFMELERRTRERMKESRFQHSLGVADTCVLLSSMFSMDETAARIVGLYHDWYRYIGDEDALVEARRFDFPLEEEELESPMLLHGPVAAFHMRENLGKEVPQEYITAVRWHTLGSKDMGRLGAVLYVADFAEPGRKHLDEKERSHILGLDSLEKMVLHILSSQQKYFESKGIRSAKVSLQLLSFLEEGGVFA